MLMSDAVFLWFSDKHTGRFSENKQTKQKNKPKQGNLLSLDQQHDVCAALGLLFCSLLRAKKENHSESGRRGERVSWEMDRNNLEEQKDN